MIQIKAKDSNGEFLTTLVQWDTGITVYLAHELITEAYEVHFANTEDGTAVVVEGEYTDGVLSADIPDALLEDVEPILGYVYDGTKSILNFRINITPRAMPVSTSEEEEEADTTASTSTTAISEGVVFIDHDGTTLYTYTWDAISALTALPELPTWTAGTEYGLEIPMTCTSWNWSLENIQNYATHGGLLTVGAVYEPTDGKTHIVYRVDNYNDAALYFYNNDVSSSLNIDWGDGTTDASEDGESGVVEFTHTYSGSAYYDIAVWGKDFYLGTGDANVAQAPMGQYSAATLTAHSIVAALICGCTITSCSFMGTCSLQQVTIPDGVTSIGDEALASCYSLTSLTIPDGVTSIGDEALANCRSLTSLTIPDSVTSIGDSAFYNCYSLTSLTISEGVESIGQQAFYMCCGLTSLTLPSSITSIGAYAFYNCYGLTSLTIPDTVTSIENSTFYGCYSLTSLTIPDSVTSIGQNAFYGCYSLTSLTILGSVTSIGNYAFYNCYSLTSLTILGSVTSIGIYAFYNCYGLTSFIIPDGVTSIGQNAFYACYSLTSLTIPDSVTSIGTYALRRSGLVNLDGLYIASTATSMFDGTYNLVNLTNVRYIGKDIDFSSCEKLTVDSLNNIIAALCDTTSSRTLTIGDTNLAKLTDDEIAVATDKGWTVV